MRIQHESRIIALTRVLTEVFEQSKTSNFSGNDKFIRPFVFDVFFGGGKNPEHLSPTGGVFPRYLWKCQCPYGS